MPFKKLALDALEEVARQAEDRYVNQLSMIRTGGGGLRTCHEVEEESSKASSNALSKAKRSFLFGAQVGVADGADKGVTYTEDKLLLYRQNYVAA